MLSQNTYLSMELALRLILESERVFSLKSSCWDPVTSDRVSLTCIYLRGGIFHIHRVHLNDWKAVSKETRAKNIKSLYQREKVREREKQPEK